MNVYVLVVSYVAALLPRSLHPVEGCRDRSAKKHVHHAGIDTGVKGTTRFRKPRARCSIPSVARALLRARGFQIS